MDNQLEKPSKSAKSASPPVETPVISANQPPNKRTISWFKVPLFFVSLFFFILAITFMKEGAEALVPLVQNSFSITSATNSLGFGWLFAYVVMSGSPVAAAALTFFDAGVLDILGTFTMITGSRLGASFIVLFIGFIYVLRGRNRATSLDMGLLSLIVTAGTYVPALFLGAFMLQNDILTNFHPQSSTLLTAVTDYLFDPIVNWTLAYLPRTAVFVLGFVIIIISFNLFDRCLPEMSIKESQVGHMSQLVYRPIVMFLLGGLVTLVSMSVTVSLSLLVPLSDRGFVRRENVIPYIMGANITTFIDTLFAAALMDNPQAFTVVLLEMIAVTIISLAILITVYRPYERYTLVLVSWITARNRNLAVFMLTILVVPIILMFL